MSRAISGNSSGKYLASIVDEFAKFRNILIIKVIDVVFAEMAHL